MDHYAVLGLDHNCTLDDIRTQYRRLALIYHPDVNPGDEERSTQRTREINEAYEVLSDPGRRRQYDAKREASRTAAPSDPLGRPGPRQSGSTESFTYVWTKPPSGSYSSPLAGRAVSAFAVFLMIFLSQAFRASTPYSTPVSTFAPAQSHYESNNSQSSADDYNERIIVTDYNDTRRQALMSLAHGDETYASVSRMPIDMSTAEGTVRKHQIDQLDRDMQDLRLTIQKMDVDERLLVYHTSQDQSLAYSDLSSDIQSTSSCGQSVDQDLNYFVNYR